MFDYVMNEAAIAASPLGRMDPHTRALALEEIQLLAKEAYAAQGDAAFEYPKTAAAAHEAAHCIEHAASGTMPTSVYIAMRRIGIQNAWVGFTDGPNLWRVDRDTTPENDLAEARHQIAGLIGEVVLEGDNFRQASSLDEVAIFKIIVTLAAVKLGVPEQSHQMQMREMARVGELLARNRMIHKRIARRLLRDHKIDGVRLRRMLSGVVVD